MAQPLGDVAKALHDEKLLTKSTASTKLFKKFETHFELMPPGKPNQVRFILPPKWGILFDLTRHKPTQLIKAAVLRSRRIVQVGSKTGVKATFFRPAMLNTC